MANVKITDLAAYTNPDSTDVLPIVDVGADVTKKISIADLLENAGSGTAAAPGIAFDGDNNTGIYRPGADQLALATNGTGRLFIDSSGNISLGQASSALQSGGTGLTIYGASASEIKFLNSTTGSANTDGTALVTTNSNFTINNREAGNIIFGTSNTERLRITSDGKVGVGTSSPSKLLEIGTGGASENSNYMVRINRGVTGEYADLSADNGFATIDGINGSGGGVRFLGDGNEYARIDGSGRLGIGTTDPTAPLNVKGGNNDGVSVIIEDNPAIISNASSASTFKIKGGNSTSIGKAGGQIDLVGGSASTDAGAIKFRTGTNTGEQNEKARLDASGRLLVGTSTARDNFYYSTTGRTPGLQFEASGSDTALSVLRTDGLAALYLANAGTVVDDDGIGGLSFVGNDGTNLRSFAKIEAQADGTVSTADVPGRLVFSVTSDGSASPTEALRISNDRSITVSDGGDVVLGTTTGTKIGTATSQKIGFYNATPVVQPTTGVAEAAFVENSGGTAVNVDSTFGGYTIQQVVEALQTLGLLA